ncbi:MAG: peptidoglycan DD-metalloendopeptidase family protein [Clostridiales bacterium]|nr:peptidoglycan DD-metalloendopeptidase family protein [Clostridiales bacterium]
MLRKLRYDRFAALVGMILAVALLVGPVFATADDDPLEDYLSEQRQAVQNMRQIEKEIAAGKTQKTKYEQEIVSLDAQLVVLGQEINAAETAIKALNVQIEDAEAAIVVATERLNERQAYLESRLRDIYINGDITMLDVFFSSASFDEYLMLADMVERIMVQDKKVLDDIVAARAIIEEEKARLQKAKADQEFILAELEAKNNELSRLQNQKAKAASELTMTIAQLKAKYEEEEAASAAAAEKIKELLASRAKVAYYGGQFVWPLPGAYTDIGSDYGMRFHPILKRNLMHSGIDVAAPGGTDIFSVGAGQILFTGWLGGYGNAVMIDHGGGVVTVYGHLSRFGKFREGDTVVPFDVIGYVGSTGQSTGNHLHFEVRLDGATTNPRPYLGR